VHISIACVSFMEELLKLSEGNIIHQTYVIQNNNYDCSQQNHVDISSLTFKVVNHEILIPTHD
jgi:hypothetical protein